MERAEKFNYHGVWSSNDEGDENEIDGSISGVSAILRELWTVVAESDISKLELRRKVGRAISKTYIINIFTAFMKVWMGSLGCVSPHPAPDDAEPSPSPVPATRRPPIHVQGIPQTRVSRKRVAIDPCWLLHIRVGFRLARCDREIRV